MRLQAYDDNGTMKFRQVSGSQALDSLPVGTTIGYSGSVAPNGYLFCDGSTFDAAKYPELYSVLGSNTLPELFDHSKPSDYETFTGNTASAQYDGEISAVGTTGDTAQVSLRITINGETVMLGGNQFVGCGAISFKKGDTISYSSLRTTPIFYVRYYKQHLLIKAATIGIADIDINTIKQELTYSTEETMTGKTWIDGKPIYRQVITGNSGNNFTVSTEIETLISSYGWFLTSTANTYRPIGVNDSGYVVFPDINISTGVLTMKQVNFSNKPFVLTIEYTKR